MTFKKDLVLLLKPYYWVNILLSVSYIIAKRTPIICTFLFDRAEDCELNGRETEILFFALIVVMIRTRKAGSVTMINYLTSAFMYTKVTNLFLWFYGDVRFGIVFGVVFVLVGLVIPEPTYAGPEFVTYFRSLELLDEELERDKRIVWLVEFHTVWNPACVNFAPIFSQISCEYNLDNLRFGKIDVSRSPDAGKKYHVSDSTLSRQLPTLLLFRNGKPVTRRPTTDNNGKLQKFFFSEDNVKAAFDLNNLYRECKDNPIKPVGGGAVEKKKN